MSTELKPVSRKTGTSSIAPDTNRAISRPATSTSCRKSTASGNRPETGTTCRSFLTSICPPTRNIARSLPPIASFISAINSRASRRTATSGRSRKKWRVAAARESWAAHQFPLSRPSPLDGPVKRRQGSHLHQHSPRHGVAGGHEVWISSQNPRGEWQELLNLSDMINTAGEDMCWTFTPDGARFSGECGPLGSYNTMSCGCAKTISHSKKL